MRHVLMPIAAAAILLSACGGGEQSHSFAFLAPNETPAHKASQGQPSIRLLSTRADMVTGGDALVEIAPPSGAELSTVELGGSDVSGKLVKQPDGRLVGLLTGLPAGEAVLTARVDGGGQARLTLVNHPAHGPVFSGPRQSPWICETSASGLGDAPASGPCVASTKYDWFYRSTAGTFEPLPSTSQPYPSDMARTTTIDGTEVNYIVRVESGTINESIYRIAILDDPANPIRDPWASGGKTPGAAWNGKLTWPFLGGCGPGFRSGNSPITTALQDTPLSLGFAVAFGTRNTMGTGCNDVISAETVMMIKERFIEQYGIPKFTIGSGGSGGAMQQHLIAQNYPGLLDALTPFNSYPDLASIAVDVMDCRLLNNYFDKHAAAWPAQRRTAVDGYAIATIGSRTGTTTCQTGWVNFARIWQDPVNGGFSAVVPMNVRYDPVSNPTGIRSTYWDGNVNSMGKDPVTGFARSAYSNVGIQYGLHALSAGSITPEEFVHLNESLGGIDIDGGLVSTRIPGDLIGIRRAYQSGRVINDVKDLTLPMIDTRNYRDLEADIHTRERTLMFIERLKKGNGTADNQVNWTATVANSPDLPRLALLAHNKWLEAIAADNAPGSYAEKVSRNKPADLKDTCWVDGVKIEEPISWDPTTRCNQAMPIHRNVRLMAGGPLTGDVLKCSLTPVDFSKYSVTFTPSQRQRLLAVFPEGVCDWTNRGVEQHKPAGTWLDYSSGRWGPSNIFN